jgi:hypothetical protein
MDRFQCVSVVDTCRQDTVRPPCSPKAHTLERTWQGDPFVLAIQYQSQNANTSQVFNALPILANGEPAVQFAVYDVRHDMENTKLNGPGVYQVDDVQKIRDMTLSQLQASSHEETSEVGALSKVRLHCA